MCERVPCAENRQEPSTSPVKVLSVVHHCARRSHDIIFPDNDQENLQNARTKYHLMFVGSVMTDKGVTQLLLMLRQADQHA
jgi:hypothetical protein